MTDTLCSAFILLNEKCQSACFAIIGYLVSQYIQDKGLLLHVRHVNPLDGPHIVTLFFLFL